MPIRRVALLLALALPCVAHADPGNTPDPNALPAPPNVSSPPANARRTPSGLRYLVLARGSGSSHPTTADRVEVHYTGWTTDGRMFDSSRTRGQPAIFPVSGVIAGFAEALQLMAQGDRYRIWIPENLAYQGRPGAPQGMLVFEIELLRIET
jgi:peptidylprolyl isomerase